MVDETINTYSKYPNKRLISHFMQPHHPFIGDLGKILMPNQTGFNNDRYEAADRSSKKLSETLTAWDYLENGDVSEQEVWRAYKENLELILPYVRQLNNNLNGKSVVTADHGNLINDWVGLSKLSGHPSGIHVDELVKVPWLIMEPTGPRRDINLSDENPHLKDISSDVDERLDHLGYT
jgi:hypothetical protein